MWTQIRLLLKEQSDLGPHCLPVCKNRFEKFARIFSRRHKQTFSDGSFFGVLRVNEYTNNEDPYQPTDKYAQSDITLEEAFFQLPYLT